MIDKSIISRQGFVWDERERERRGGLGGGGVAEDHRQGWPSSPASHRFSLGSLVSDHGPPPQYTVTSAQIAEDCRSSPPSLPCHACTNTHTRTHTREREGGVSE